MFRFDDVEMEGRMGVHNWSSYQYSSGDSLADGSWHMIRCHPAGNNLKLHEERMNAVTRRRRQTQRSSCGKNGVQCRVSGLPQRICTSRFQPWCRREGGSGGCVHR